LMQRVQRRAHNVEQCVAGAGRRVSSTSDGPGQRSFPNRRGACMHK
jgi:hypothetical protein